MLATPSRPVNGYLLFVSLFAALFAGLDLVDLELLSDAHYHGAFYNHYRRQPPLWLGVIRGA
jgi:hypothetical protein